MRVASTDVRHATKSGLAGGGWIEGRYLAGIADAAGGWARHREAKDNGTVARGDIHLTKPTPPELARIYETHHGKVRAYAARLLGRDDAEDVAQDVFIKVGRSLETLADPSKLESWIFAITLNTIRDAARRRASGPLAAARRERAPGDTEEEAIARIPDPGARTPEAILARSEMVTCYLDYVRQLPPSYHEVYVLSEFEDLPNEEIARRLSVSVGTVKIRLHRARTRLNGELRRNCRCYYDERGELVGGRNDG